tara:strand:- start:174 stop:1010 length:837 start_codon:yes stop_codon:yes gene_type:complete
VIKKIKLPQYLNPYENKNIIRLGNDYDGGYLVDKETVLSSDILVSIGISYDWSFEKDFYKLNSCLIYSYDGSVGKKFFYAKIKNRIKNIFNKNSGEYLIKTFWWIILPFRFFIFFNNFRLVNRKQHFEMFVYENNKKLDIDYFVHKNGYSPKFIRFYEIIEKIPSDKKIFLKIDIEGEEYSLLDSLIRYQYRFNSLVIEFHNLDKNNYKILEEFIQKFNLTLSHTHINIAGGFNDDVMPKVIELTFVKNLKKEKKVEKLPHLLDMDTYPTNIKHEVIF